MHIKRKLFPRTRVPVLDRPFRFSRYGIGCPQATPLPGFCVNRHRPVLPPWATDSRLSSLANRWPRRDLIAMWLPRQGSEACRERPGAPRTVTEGGAPYRVVDAQGEADNPCRHPLGVGSRTWRRHRPYDQEKLRCSEHTAADKGISVSVVQAPLRTWRREQTASPTFRFHAASWVRTTRRGFRGSRPVLHRYPGQR